MNGDRRHHDSSGFDRVHQSRQPVTTTTTGGPLRSPSRDRSGQREPSRLTKQRYQPPRGGGARRGRAPSPAPSQRPVSSNRPTIVELSDEALPAALTADGYWIGSTVGHGSYSKVRVAVCSLPGRTAVRVACKVINKVHEASSSYVRKFLPRELEVLCAVRHPNLVRTHRIYATPSAVHVFMDYCENGDLLDYLQFAKGIPPWQAHTFFKQITEAVDYLHRNQITHRDIKCDNVLLESAEHVMLTDFGFARMCADVRGRRLLSQTFCGSSSYAAPEVLQCIPYDPKAYDVWALGVVLYVMLADTMPYPYSSYQEIVANQKARNFAKPKKPVSPDAFKLVSIILEPDVTQRATMSQIKNHQWFKRKPDLHDTTGWSQQNRSNNDGFWPAEDLIEGKGRPSDSILSG